MIALLALMFAGCLCLWIGVPLAWLWIGSQIEAATSLGTALAASMIGAITTIIGIFWVLTRLDALYAERRLAKAEREGEVPLDDDDEGEPSGALEPMIVSSAAIALVGFGIWFFFLAGTSPVPLNIGY